VLESRDKVKLLESVESSENSVDFGINQESQVVLLPPLSKPVTAIREVDTPVAMSG
jgi:hypothetical protein